MNNTTLVGVDLARDVVQVCVSYKNKVLSNTEKTPAEFTSWLANQKRAIVVFEACATSNYWKRKAIVQASTLPDVTFIAGKSQDQQQLQPFFVCVTSR